MMCHTTPYKNKLFVATSLNGSSLVCKWQPLDSISACKDFFSPNENWPSMITCVENDDVKTWHIFLSVKMFKTICVTSVDFMMFRNC